MYILSKHALQKCRGEQAGRRKKKKKRIKEPEIKSKSYLTQAIPMQKTGI